MPPRERLQIVIPVYNEAELISKTFEEIRDKVAAPCELWVVYDSPEDTTVSVVKRVQKRFKFPIHLERNHYGKGALNAIKSGFEACHAGPVIVMMADLSDDLCAVNAMYDKIVREGYDIVCGSRYMKGGRQIGGPMLKKMMSRAAGVSLNVLTGIPTHDISNSFKIYKNEIVKKTKIESSGGFELGLELLVKAFIAGKKIGEVPSVWQDRSAGKSNFKLWKWLPSYLRWYFFALFHKKAKS